MSFILALFVDLGVKGSAIHIAYVFSRLASLVVQLNGIGTSTKKSISGVGTRNEIEVVGKTLDVRSAFFQTFPIDTPT